MSGGADQTVGFVGLGKMGWPMAHNLATAGYDLVVRDADAARQSSFAAEHGCRPAEHPGDFAAARVVVTMLPDDTTVWQAIVEWEGGIGSRLPADAVVVDMSSSHPDGTTRLGAELAPLGVAVVDAPVSGGVPRAEAGTLTLMIGGDDEDAIERVRPVLEVLGERLFRTGPLASGHAMKALNNFVAGGTYAIVVEALAVGGRFGLDPATMIDVMNASTGRSFITEDVVKDHVLTGVYGTGFAVGLLAKDTGIARLLAEASGVEAPLCGIVGRRWADASAALGPSADHSEAHKAWRDAKLRDAGMTVPSAKASGNGT